MRELKRLRVSNPRKGRMMIAKFRIEDPDNILATMEITMSIKDWNELRNQLDEAHPSWRLSSAIRDLLSQARKVFYPNPGLLEGE